LDLIVNKGVQLRRKNLQLGGRSGPRLGGEDLDFLPVRINASPIEERDRFFKLLFITVSFSLWTNSSRVISWNIIGFLFIAEGLDLLGGVVVRDGLGDDGARVPGLVDMLLPT